VVEGKGGGDERDEQQDEQAESMLVPETAYFLEGEKVDVGFVGDVEGGDDAD